MVHDEYFSTAEIFPYLPNTFPDAADRSCTFSLLVVYKVSKKFW
jgi:hypothetical protein